MTELQSVKTLLNINDNLQDELLALIISQTKQQILNKLGTEEIPAELTHVTVEVAIKRFNRIGAEGMTSLKEGDVTNAYSADDFDQYKVEMAKFAKKGSVARGWQFL